SNGLVANFAALPDGKTFTFDLVRTADGPFSVAVPDAAAVSILGVPNDPGSFSGSFDATPPLVSVTPAAPFPTSLSAVSVTVKFSEPVTGFDASGLSVSGPAVVSNFQP